MWASSIHYMNDATEFANAMGLVKAQLERIEGFEPAELSDFKRIITSQLESISRIYVFVFSLSEQSDLLSQWRGYAGGGGFAVEFEWERLKRVAGRQGFLLGRCLYRTDQKEAVVKQMLKVAQEVYWRCVRQGAGREHVAGELWKRFVQDFVRVSPLLKHYSFHEEREWRLVSRPTNMDAPEVDYREGHSMLVPYFKLSLEDGSGGMPVSGVVVGPCPHPELSQNSVVNFVQKSANFKQLSARCSQIPYREW